MEYGLNYKSSRKQGVGKHLIEHISKQHPECDLIQTKSEPNEDTFKFFLKNGFKCVDAKKHYYSNDDFSNDFDLKPKIEQLDLAKCVDGTLKLIKKIN